MFYFTINMYLLHPLVLDYLVNPLIKVLYISNTIVNNVVLLIGIIVSILIAKPYRYMCNWLSGYIHFLGDE